MPKRRKASKARIENLQAARDTKRRRSTPAESTLSDGDEGRASDDAIVHLNSFKANPTLIHDIPDGQQQ